MISTKNGQKISEKDAERANKAIRDSYKKVFGKDLKE